MKRRAFTLIEMLVVAAILAILAGLLLPVFAQARDAGRAAACASNLRQLGMAFAMRLQDYGAYPGAAYGGRPQSDDWVDVSGGYYHINVAGGALFPYVKNERVYTCLSDGRATERRLSYSMNRLLDHYPDALARPSERLLLLEEDEQTVWGTGVNDGLWDVETNIDKLASHHSGSGRVLWADGHVTPMRPERVARIHGVVPEVFLP
jgi:prepilin-type N-terminal cleavage/methylation domain-containing protein/prepilin-type processing-associated H-X9-DG protein